MAFVVPPLLRIAQDDSVTKSTKNWSISVTRDTETPDARRLEERGADVTKAKLGIWGILDLASA